MHFDVDTDVKSCHVMAGRRTLIALWIFLYFIPSTCPAISPNSSGNFILPHSTNLKVFSRRSSCLKHEIVKHTKHGSCVVSLPFDSHVTLSTYFAVCCDVHSNPGPTSATYNRHQAGKHRNNYTSDQSLNSPINNTTLHESALNSSLPMVHLSAEHMDLSITAYKNVNSLYIDQQPDLLDLFINAYSNIQRFHYAESSTSSIMNTDVKHKNIIPVRITRRTKVNSQHYTGRHTSFSNLVDASERSSHNAHYTKSNNFHYTLHSRNVNNLKQIEICRQKEMKLRFAVWNARSIAKKAAIVCDIIQSNKLEILAITESWLGKNTDDSSITEILNRLKTYSFVHVSRESGKGGGVGVFYSKQLSITMNSDNVFKSFEHINLNVVSGKLNTRLIVIYRPPPSKKNKLKTSMFFTEFHDLLELMSQHEQPLLIAGDFNFHLDDTTNCDTIKFMDILDSANLSQHVLGSTHRKGHTLDLIITQHNSNLVTDVRILNDVFSDHQVVTCKLNCPRPPLSKIPLTFRSTKQLNGDVFIATLKESLANKDLSVKTDIDEMVDIYNSTLKDIYDKLAPVQTRVVNHRPWAPWYNEDLREAKREKRRAERKFRKTKLTVNKQMYIEACERYNRLLENC